MDPLVIFFILALVFSIIIHEVSHGFAAEMLGDPTARLQGRLTLNPLSHIDPIGTILVPGLMFFMVGYAFGWAKPVPYNPYNLRNQRWGEAIVAGAGPGVNILLALLFGLVARFGEGVLSHNFIVVAGVVVFINILLALFNLIPFPPLDGSKLLKSLLPWRASMAFQRFEAIIMSGGMLFAILLLWMLMQVIGGVFGGVMVTVFSALTGLDANILCEGMPWLCS
jgi:Zn-dependent protease